MPYSLPFEQSFLSGTAFGIYEVFRVVVLTSHANDLTNAKSHATKKPLPCQKDISQGISSTRSSLNKCDNFVE